ncbi:hypothetical protein BKA80DRAFT_319423 [Phyllosticta citrichinensis]
MTSDPSSSTSPSARSLARSLPPSRAPSLPPAPSHMSYWSQPQRNVPNHASSTTSPATRSIIASLQDLASVPGSGPSNQQAVVWRRVLPRRQQSRRNRPVHDVADHQKRAPRLASPSHRPLCGVRQSHKPEIRLSNASPPPLQGVLTRHLGFPETLHNQVHGAHNCQEYIPPVWFDVCRAPPLACLRQLSDESLPIFTGKSYDSAGHHNPCEPSISLGGFRAEPRPHSRRRTFDGDFCILFAICGVEALEAESILPDPCGVLWLDGFICETTHLAAVQHLQAHLLRSAHQVARPVQVGFL